MSAFLFESRRLGYREFTPDDANILFRLNADPEVIRYTGDPPFADEGEARAFVLNYDQYRLYGHGRWIVADKDKNEVLGWCGLKNEDGVIDLGYRFFRSAWGKGYATEAAQSCIDFGFSTLEMPRITGRVMPENAASCRVLEKVGMTFTGFGGCNGFEGARIYAIERERPPVGSITSGISSEDQ